MKEAGALKKTAIVIACLLTFAVMLSACTPSGEAESSSSEDTVIQTSESSGESDVSGGSDSSGSAEFAPDISFDEAFPTGDLFLPETFLPESITEAQEEDLNRSARAYTPAETLDIRNTAPSFYFYEHISKEAQQVYDAMYMVAMDPTTLDNVVNFRVSWDASKRENWVKYYWVAERALSFDHPELWWANPANGTYSFYPTYTVNPYSDGTYGIYIRMNQAYTDVKKDIEAFNKAVDAFLSDIDAGASGETLTRLVHNKLLTLCTYNDRVWKDQSADLARTAYGALVADSMGAANTALCSGYSLAYVYLLQQRGMEATIVEGLAASGSNQPSGHLWNIVKDGDKWFEFDVCWDDNMLEYVLNLPRQYTNDPNRYQLFSEAANDYYFTDSISHCMYRLTTSSIRDYSMQVRFTASNGWYWDWKHYSVRYRFDETDPNSADGILMKLAPIAE